MATPKPAAAVLGALMEIPPTAYVAVTGEAPMWTRIWMGTWLSLWLLLTVANAARHNN